MSQQIRSYTSATPTSRLPGGMAHEFWQLLRRSAQGASDVRVDVRELIDTARAVESLVWELTGVRLAGLKGLEIGVGQLPRQHAYFAMANQVVGIDLDVVPSGWQVRKYIQLLRQNGPKRFVKTVARKFLGFDSQFCREMARQLRLPAPARMDVRQMDAMRMSFPDASFDFVYSFDVFEHLPDVPAVLREIVRVLKPGGCAFNYVHPYTAEDGSHDLRIRKTERNGMPYWAHLRPQHVAQVRQVAYLNRLRLEEWRRLFQSHMPGGHLICWPQDRPEFHTTLVGLRQVGELSAYTDEELLARRLVTVWKKPDVA